LVTRKDKSAMPGPLQGTAGMRDISIARAFVAMLICPAILASLQKTGNDDEA
jgi:hypothetical protein